MYLQDYLETKRIAFPRFYFVAPADLLDILSKGSNPQLILRHLSKCFDNVHNLSFKPHEITGEPTKVCGLLSHSPKPSVSSSVAACSIITRLHTLQSSYKLFWCLGRSAQGVVA